MIRLVGFSISGIPTSALNLACKDFGRIVDETGVTWTTSWTQVAQYCNSFLPLFENPALHGGREFFLTIEYTSNACELQALFACDFRHGASGRQVSSENTGSH